MPKRIVYILLFCFCYAQLHAQTTDDLIVIQKKDTLFIPNEEIDILAPSKAAFYSAVLPGLGQIYNKKYWKVPIVYGAIGTGVYFYVHNSDLYNEYRDAYKLRIAGRPDPYSEGNTQGNPVLTVETLERAQNVYRKNKDLSLFITIGLYILNIVEANVDAHLPDKALNTNISFNPGVFTTPVTNQAVYGATISFNF